MRHLLGVSGIRKSGIRLSLLLMALLAATHPALATTVIIPPDDDLIIGARAIVRGKVLAVECGREGDRIFTYVTVRVREVIKGQIAERKIILKEPGGQVGPEGSIIFGTPRFKRGEEVLVYLDTWKDGSLRVH